MYQGPADLLFIDTDIRRDARMFVEQGISIEITEHHRNHPSMVRVWVQEVVQNVGSPDRLRITLPTGEVYEGELIQGPAEEHPPHFYVVKLDSSARP